MKWPPNAHAYTAKLFRAGTSVRCTIPKPILDAITYRPTVCTWVVSESGRIEVVFDALDDYHQPLK